MIDYVKQVVGNKYNRLTVLSYIGSKNYSHRILCLCDCGAKKEVDGWSVVRGLVKSCGCLLKEWYKKPKKHGMSNTKEYKTWNKIKQRCLNPNNDRFNRYGKRGIKVCRRWLNSFDNFFKDMGYAPSKKHTIERINNNKNYSPSNCIWATRDIQNRNTSFNKYVIINGEKKCISEWCKIYGLNRGSVQSRLNKGMNPKEAILKPFDMRMSNWHKRYEYNGVSKSLTGWSQEYGISRFVIMYRIKRGWSMKDALNTPLISAGHTLTNFKKRK